MYSHDRTGKDRNLSPNDQVAILQEILADKQPPTQQYVPKTEKGVRLARIWEEKVEESGFNKEGEPKS